MATLVLVVFCPRRVSCCSRLPIRSSLHFGGNGAEEWWKVSAPFPAHGLPLVLQPQAEPALTPAFNVNHDINRQGLTTNSENRGNLASNSLVLVVVVVVAVAAVAAGWCRGREGGGERGRVGVGGGDGGADGAIAHACVHPTKMVRSKGGSRRPWCKPQPTPRGGKKVLRHAHLVPSFRGDRGQQPFPSLWRWEPWVRTTMASILNTYHWT